MVLALSFFQDQAAGLDLIFMVFTGILLLTVPLVLLIPEAAQPPALRVLRPLPGSSGKPATRRVRHPPRLGRRLISHAA